MEQIKELIEKLNLDTYEIRQLIKEIKEDLDDEDYSSEDISSSDEDLEKECIDETLKVNVDEKHFMSLDLEFKSSSTNKDECE